MAREKLALRAANCYGNTQASFHCRARAATPDFCGASTYSHYRVGAELAVAAFAVRVRARWTSCWNRYGALRRVCSDLRQYLHETKIR